jgi:predicted DsbA family dithiol-disulfide isomerase
MMRKLTVEVWSDIVCPWCAIGHRRLEAALARFSHRADVEVVWRAFELDPSAPPVREGDHVEHIARKYGRTRAQVEDMIRQITATAAKDGLELDLLRARAGNTFDAHRLLRLAADRGKEDALRERLSRGYMAEGEAIGDHATLARLASEAGLGAADVEELLGGDRYAAEVRADEAKARALEIHGVPFFLVGGQLAVSGAQPAEVLVRAMDQAWQSDVALAIERPRSTQM